MKETMKEAEKLDRVLGWMMGLSVALLGLSSAVMSVAALAGLPLPPELSRALGIVNLLALPVLVYSTVRKLLAARRAPVQPVKTAATNGVKKTEEEKEAEIGRRSDDRPPVRKSPQGQLSSARSRSAEHCSAFRRLYFADHWPALRE